MMKSLCGTALGLMLLAFFPVSERDSLAQPYAAGHWQLADSVETRRPDESSREVWTADGGWGRLTSQLVDQHGAGPHRVEFTWSGAGEYLSPGAPCEVALGALVLDAMRPAPASISVQTWTSPDATAHDAPPPGEISTTTLVVNDGEPQGFAGLARAAIRVPSPAAGEPQLVRALHVRIVVTHRGNTISFVRSYAWVPVGVDSAAAD